MKNSHLNSEFTFEIHFSGGGGHAVVISGGGVNLRLMEERLSRLEETVNSDPGLAERLRTMEARISQLQVRCEKTKKIAK